MISFSNMDSFLVLPSVYMHCPALKLFSVQFYMKISKARFN